MRNPKAVDVLVEALRDEEIAGHAIAALGQLRAAKARSQVEGFVDHPKAWIRKEARKALSKLGA
jgi:HEAT repeat protein